MAMTPLQDLLSATLGLLLTIVTVMVTRITFWIRSLELNRPHRQMELTQKENTEIYVILHRLLWQLGAMRVYMSKFHNGNRFLDGTDINKKTRTHEVVRPGVAYQGEEFKGQLISTMIDEIELILEEGASFRRVENLSNSKFKWLCECGGVHAVARCGIWINGNLVGFLGADFDDEVREQPANVEDMCTEAFHVRQILEEASANPPSKPSIFDRRDFQ